MSEIHELHQNLGKLNKIVQDLNLQNTQKATKKENLEEEISQEEEELEEE